MPYPAIPGRQMEEWQGRLLMRDEEIEAKHYQFCTNYPGGKLTFFCSNTFKAKMIQSFKFSCPLLIIVTVMLSSLFSGMMTKDEFIKLATYFLPSPDLKIFASNIFKLFDENRNGFLDFGEFEHATSTQVS